MSKVRDLKVPERPKLDDVAGWERATYSLGGVAPRYNPDLLASRQGLGIYRRMRVDEQVKAVLTFKRAAVMGRGWSLSYEDGSPLDETERELRIRVMTKALNNMTGQFDSGLKKISTAREFGFSMTEKVVTEFDCEGKTYLGLSRLLRRDQCTFLFYTDEFGLLDRCVQRVGGKEQKVDMSRFVHFVHTPETDEYYGESDLRAAYRSWYLKERIGDYWALYLEKFGGGFMIVTQEGDTSQPLVPNSPLWNSITQVLNNLHGASGIILPKGIKATLEFPPAQGDFEHAIVHHDLGIAKALLVPNLLGLSHSDGGSSLGEGGKSETQLEAFGWTINEEAGALATCVGEQIIYPLAKANWGDDEYPCFKFKPPSIEHMKWVIETWVKLVGASTVINTEGDEAYLRSLLGMPKRDQEAKPLIDPAVQAQQQLAQDKHGLAADGQSFDQKLQKRQQDEAERAARIAEKKPKVASYNFDPSQARDESGRWASEGADVIAFHGTSREFVSRIRKQGIKVGGARTYMDTTDGGSLLYRGERGESVYVASSQADAEAYAYHTVGRRAPGSRYNPVVLELHIPKAEFKAFKPDKNHDIGVGKAAYKHGSIPKEWIRGAYEIRPDNGGTVKKIFSDGTATAFVVVFVNNKEDMVATPHGELRNCTLAQFTAASQRVAFSVIEQRQTVEESRMSDLMAAQVARSVARLLGNSDLLTSLTDTNVEDVAAVELSSSEKARLNQAARQGLRSAWDLGVSMARNELDRASGERRAAFTDLRDRAAAYFEARAFRMAGDLSDQVRNVMQQELFQSVKSGRSPELTREAIWGRLVDKGMTTRSYVRQNESDEGVQRALDRLWMDSEEQAKAYLDTMARTNLFEAMNEARFAEFTDPTLGTFVQAMAYSAVLDDRTTDICAALNGATFAADSELWDTYRPPNHFNCRGVLIPITEADGWDGQDSPEPDLEPAAGFGKGEK